MQKWEYLVIGGIRSTFNTYYPKAYRITEKGRELLTDFKNLPGGTAEEDAVAQYIARLGMEGWEMVATGGDQSYHCIYFKRAVIVDM